MRNSFKILLLSCTALMSLNGIFAATGEDDRSVSPMSLGITNLTEHLAQVKALHTAQKIAKAQSEAAAAAQLAAVRQAKAQSDAELAVVRQAKAEAEAATLAAKAQSDEDLAAIRQAASEANAALSAADEAKSGLEAALRAANAQTASERATAEKLHDVLQRSQEAVLAAVALKAERDDLLAHLARENAANAESHEARIDQEEKLLSLTAELAAAKRMNTGLGAVNAERDSLAGQVASLTASTEEVRAQLQGKATIIDSTMASIKAFFPTSATKPEGIANFVNRMLGSVKTKNEAMRALTAAACAKFSDLSIMGKSDPEVVLASWVNPMMAKLEAVIAENASLGAQLAARDAAMDSLRAQLADKDTTLTALHAELAARDAAMDSLRAQLAAAKATAAAPATPATETPFDDDVFGFGSAQTSAPASEAGTLDLFASAVSAPTTPTLVPAAASASATAADDASPRKGSSGSTSSSDDSARSAEARTPTSVASSSAKKFAQGLLDTIKGKKTQPSK